jgi:hypothetical protein
MHDLSNIDSKFGYFFLFLKSKLILQSALLKFGEISTSKDPELHSIVR